MKQNVSKIALKHTVHSLLKGGEIQNKIFYVVSPHVTLDENLQNDELMAKMDEEKTLVIKDTFPTINIGFCCFPTVT